MQITIEPTDELTVVEGTTARQWCGYTDRMVPVKVFVVMIAARGDDNLADFEHFARQLELPPELEQRRIPIRLIL
jgi:hypothetical protein